MVTAVFQCLSRYLRLILVFGTLLALISCGGGSGSGGSSVVYTGLTGPANINTTNTGEIISLVLGNQQTSRSLVALKGGSTSAVQEKGWRLYNLRQLLIRKIPGTRHARSVSGKQISALRPSIVKEPDAVAIDEFELCDNGRIEEGRNEGGTIEFKGFLNPNGTGIIKVTYQECIQSDETIHGFIELHLYTSDYNTGEILDADLRLVDLRISGPDYSVQIAGEISILVNPAVNTESLVINGVFNDGIKTYKAENLEYFFNNYIAEQSSGFTKVYRSEHISGRIYHPEIGYVDILTIEDLKFTTNYGYVYDLFAKSGAIKLIGSNRVSILVTAVPDVAGSGIGYGNQFVQVQLDLNGDNDYDTFSVLDWQDLYLGVNIDLSDSDSDGMHDSFEIEKGLDPNDPLDADFDMDNDGYTNFEEYFHGADVADDGVVPNSADISVEVRPIIYAANPGDEFTYQVTVKNNGPHLNVFDAAVVITNPAAAILESLDPAHNWICETSETEISCVYPESLQLSHDFYLHFIAPETLGPIVVSASVDSDLFDQNRSNNSVSSHIEIAMSTEDIQSQIDQAANGDTIQVEPGIYAGSLDFKQKEITLRSMNGAESTILQGSYGTPVTIYGGATLEGFTLIGGSYGESIAVENHSLNDIYIRNNIFDNRDLLNYTHTGIYNWGSTTVHIDSNIFRNMRCVGGSFMGSVINMDVASATITNNVFENNPCPAVFVSSELNGSSVITAINNTFVGNTYGVYIAGANTDHTKLIRNNIFTNNQTAIFLEEIDDLPFVAIDNNLFYENTINFTGISDLVGTDRNLQEDPLFVAASSGNYRLLDGSPAIDAGNPVDAPAFDFDSIARPQDGDGNLDAVVDIGAFEAIE